MSTIVTGTLNTLQLFALIATILFIVAAVVAFVEKTVWACLVCSGLAFLSLAILFIP